MAFQYVSIGPAIVKVTSTTAVIVFELTVGYVDLVVWVTPVPGQQDGKERITKRLDFVTSNEPVMITLEGLQPNTSYCFEFEDDWLREQQAVCTIDTLS